MSEESFSPAQVQFREEIRDCLLLLPKTCNEDDLKKKYREVTGKSISQKLVELDEKKIYDFLRFKCKDICEVYRFDKEIKIDRKADIEQLPDPENLKTKKRHKTNTAPKLNIPKVGILQSSTFRRLNPQGFNKLKSKGNAKNLINTYKHPNHVKLDDEKENAVDNEYAPTGGISLADFVPLDSPISPEFSVWDANLTSAADVVKFPPPPTFKSQSYAGDTKTLPNVQNPSDFPSLPEKHEKIGKLFDDPEDNTRENISPAKNWNEVAKKTIYKTPSPKRSSSVPPRMIKRTQSAGPAKNKVHVAYNAVRVTTIPEVQVQNAIMPIDDPIFLTNFPDIIMDPTRRLKKPRIRTVDKRITLPMYITHYSNPTNFFYQYCEISLCRLMREMQSFYKAEAKRALMISKINIRVGLLCAVLERNTWCRGIIWDSPDTNGQVKIILADFGNPIQTEMRNIRYLLDKFTRDPQKCVRGSLAGVKPFRNEKWSNESLQKFFSMACGKSVQGTLVAYNAEQDSYILEISEKLTSPLSIGEQLITAKMAQPVFVEKPYPYAILL